VINTLLHTSLHRAAATMVEGGQRRCQEHEHEVEKVRYNGLMTTDEKPSDDGLTTGETPSGDDMTTGETPSEGVPGIPINDFAKGIKGFSYALDELQNMAQTLTTAQSFLRLLVEKNVRANPQKYGLEEITDETVKAAVNADGKIRQSEENLAEICHDIKAIGKDIDTTTSILSKLGDALNPVEPDTIAPEEPPDPA